MSQIITFYSYKGGVGRPMALANVATLLSKWGKKVLMIDWDLEAPGLENFFKDYLKKTDWKQQKGVLEWLYAQQNNEEVKWEDWVVKFKTKESKTDLHLLVSGKDNGNYSEMLRDFDVAKFYEKHDGGRRIEQFREELLKAYDYILIDSRTGVTDFGGICTIQMPDILVMLFSPTEQGLVGTKKIAQRILDGHSKLPFDRYGLLICPVPSRFDSTTEFQESRKWLGRISSELEELYENWLPTNVKLNEFLQIIKIPYISYFSFGEKLPVIEQGVSDPAGLGYAYENLAMLIGRGLDEVEEFVEKRDKYLEEVSGEVGIEKTQDIDLKPSVNVYMSFVEQDEKFKNELCKKLKTNSEHISIRILEFKDVPLGSSKKKTVEDLLKQSDIVFILLSKAYSLVHFYDLGIIDFSLVLKKSKPFSEYEVIEHSNHGIVVPIFISSKFDKNLPDFVMDRQGISNGIHDFTKSNSDINYILNEIMPMIKQIHFNKINASTIRNLSVNKLI